MRISRIWHLIAITLLVAVAPWPSNAAQRREWVTLTDCQKGVFVKLPTGEKGTAYVKTLESLERESRQKRLGIWANAVEHKPATQTR